jgi:hypothetical protein
MVEQNENKGIIWPLNKIPRLNIKKNRMRNSPSVKKVTRWEWIPRV